MATNNSINAPLPLSAANGGSPLTTKGDIYTYGTGNDRLAVGTTNSMVLSVNSAATDGVNWDYVRSQVNCANAVTFFTDLSSPILASSTGPYDCAFNAGTASSGAVSNVSTTYNDGTRYGVWRASTAASTTGMGYVCGFGQIGSYGLYGGNGQIIFQCSAIINQASSATDIFTLSIGLMGGVPSTTTISGLVFQYTHSVNSGNWIIKARNGGAGNSSANTSTPPDTSWHQYRIVMDATASNAYFYIDGVQVANSPLTSGLPSGNGVLLLPCVAILKAGGSTGNTPCTVDTDYFYMSKDFTTPR